MHEAFGDRMTPPPGVRRSSIADDRNGRKNGKGFYLYDERQEEGARSKVDETVYGVLGLDARQGASPTDEIAAALRARSS